VVEAEKFTWKVSGAAKAVVESQAKLLAKFCDSKTKEKRNWLDKQKKKRHNSASVLIERQRAL